MRQWQSIRRTVEPSGKVSYWNEGMGWHADRATSYRSPDTAKAQLAVLREITPHGYRLDIA